MKFNSDVGAFEVVNYAPQRLESQPKKILHDQKPPSPIYDVLSKEKNDGQLSKMHTASSTFSIDPNCNTMVSILQTLSLYLDLIVEILAIVIVVFGLVAWEKC